MDVALVGSLGAIIAALLGIIAKQRIGTNNGDHAVMFKEIKGLKADVASIKEDVKVVHKDIAQIQLDRERYMVELNLRLGEILGKLAYMESMRK